jgi:hypothetical protein
MKANHGIITIMLSLTNRATRRTAVLQMGDCWLVLVRRLGTMEAMKKANGPYIPSSGQSLTTKGVY